MSSPVMASKESIPDTLWAKNMSDLRALTDCAICSRPFYEPYIISCGHTFCFSCLQQYFSSGNQRRKTCPSCRQPVLHDPAPNFALRDITHNLISKPELLLYDETTEKHIQWANEEASILSKAKTSKGAQRSLFGFHVDGRRPLYDMEDGVHRCPNCNWELEDGECNACGYQGGDSGSEADWSSVSGESERDSPATVPRRLAGRADVIDLDGSQASVEHSSHRVRARMGRFLAGRRPLTTSDDDAESHSSEDEPGSLNGFVVNDDNISIRSSSSIRTSDTQSFFNRDMHDMELPPWESDGYPSSSEDGHSMASSALHPFNGHGMRHPQSTDLGTRNAILRSRARRRGPSYAQRRHNAASRSNSTNQRASVMVIASPPPDGGTNHRGRSSHVSPIEIESSSEDTSTSRNTIRRTRRSRLVVSDDDNSDGSDGEESIGVTHSQRHRPQRARVVLTDDDEVDHTSTASTSTGSRTRLHLRGGGDSSESESAATESSYRFREGSSSATLQASSPIVPSATRLDRHGSIMSSENGFQAGTSPTPGSRHTSPRSPYQSPTLSTNYNDFDGPATSPGSSSSGHFHVHRREHSPNSPRSVQTLSSPARSLSPPTHSSTFSHSYTDPSNHTTPFSAIHPARYGVGSNDTPQGEGFGVGSSRGDRSRVQARKQERRKAKAERKRLIRSQNSRNGGLSTARFGIITT